MKITVGYLLELEKWAKEHAAEIPPFAPNEKALSQIEKLGSPRVPSGEYKKTVVINGAPKWQRCPKKRSATK
jgi:hypothetical protein